MMIGRKLVTGDVAGTPRRLFRLPSWNTQTTKPNAAAIVRRKPTTAFTGTSQERNASSSTISARITISGRNTGSAAPSLWRCRC